MTTPTTAPGTTQPTPSVAPNVISECRGTDWYIVHPTGNWAYRMSTGHILIGNDMTSNNPAAVKGQVLIPAGVNAVSTADDFNSVDQFTRPACSVAGSTTTAPSTTSPTTPGLSPSTCQGSVAPGTQVGPGMVTFCASGFRSGEQVTVTLFSTPRGLGTVTAAANGTATITFELLASDGAGGHRVQFSGPSGTVSVPFTLVLPAAPAAPAGLPETR